MDILRTWILSVTVSAMVIAAAQALMPEGAVKRAGRLTGGLILVLGLMQPLVSMDYGDLYDLVTALPVGAVTQQDLEAQTYDSMKEIIEAELATYIVDKGEELGFACTAQVTCEMGSGNVPVPACAAVTGSLTPAQQSALSDWMASDLGIPPEAQTYRNGEA